MATRETPTHSPAPFVLDLDGDIVDARGDPVALMPDGLKDVDARLFLRAPDLLAACRDFVRTAEREALFSEPTAVPFYATMKELVDHIDGGGE